VVRAVVSQIGMVEQRFTGQGGGDDVHGPDVGGAGLRPVQSRTFDSPWRRLANWPPDGTPRCTRP
jgi:hypothetical protein